MEKLLVAAVLAVASAACVTSSSVVCDDGATCSSGTLCHRIALAPEQTVCASPDELEACADKPDFASCTAHPDGRCYSGVCQPGGCGNGRTDLAVEGDALAVEEVCDDGNRVPGDGCSADCSSDETCTNGIVDLVTGEQCDDGNARSNDGCSSACARETAAWSTPTEDTVGQRYGYALAYDARRERVVLFGGQQFAAFLHLFADTLEWDGARWHALPTIVAPSARVDMAMAYDARRDKIVLFGGRTAAGSVLGDTWELDGARWRLVPVTNPPQARDQHAMAYDPIRGVVVMAGGRDTRLAPVMETWEWNGIAWTRRETAAAPPARFGHAMAFDHSRGVMVLAGGRSRPVGGCVLLADTWEYDGANWSEKPIRGPSARKAHAMTSDPTTGHVYLSGGSTSDDDCDLGMLFAPRAASAPGTGSVADAWSFDGTTWTEAAPIGYGTASHQIAPMPGGRLVTVAGYRDAGVDQFATFERTPGGWAVRDRYNLTGEPSARTRVAASYDPVRDQVVLFGGTTGGNASNETFIWNRRWEAGPVTPAPSPRQGAAMAFDEERGEHVLFGGSASLGVATADTWLFRDAWIGAPTPPELGERSGMVMGYDPISKRVILFGGASGLFPPTYRDDTWLWNGTAWARYVGPGPSPRSNAMMALDRRRGRLVMFGGFYDLGSSFRYTDETWEWDGAGWIRLDPPQRPSGRRNAGLAYDPARERVVLFGGSDAPGQAGLLTDTWEWDGTTWTLVAVNSVTEGRENHAMTTAPGGSGVLVFGGTKGLGAVADLELMRHVADPLFERCGRNDTDGDGRIRCEDPDCGLVCARCGDGTCNGAEACNTCPSDCGACATGCGDLVCDGSETCAGDCAPTGP